MGDYMTEEKLRSELTYILTVKMLPSEAIPIVDKIFTITEQYFREAEWKSSLELLNELMTRIKSQQCP
jgi:hypothetical protein